MFVGPQHGLIRIDSPSSSWKNACEISVLDVSMWSSRAPDFFEQQVCASHRPAKGDRGNLGSPGGEAQPGTTAACEPSGTAGRGHLAPELKLSPPTPTSIIPAVVLRPALRTSSSAPHIAPAGSFQHQDPEQGPPPSSCSCSVVNVYPGQQPLSTWVHGSSARASGRVGKNVRWLDHVAKQVAAEVEAFSASIHSRALSSSLQYNSRNFQPAWPHAAASACSSRPAAQAASPGPPHGSLTIILSPTSERLSTPFADLSPEVRVSCSPRGGSVLPENSRLPAAIDSPSALLPVQAFSDAVAGGDEAVGTPSSAPASTEVSSLAVDPSSGGAAAAAAAVLTDSPAFVRRSQACSVQLGRQEQERELGPRMEAGDSVHSGTGSRHPYCPHPQNRMPQVPLHLYLSPPMLRALEHSQPISDIHTIPRHDPAHPDVYIVPPPAEATEVDEAGDYTLPRVMSRCNGYGGFLHGAIHTSGLLTALDVAAVRGEGGHGLILDCGGQVADSGFLDDDCGGFKDSVDECGGLLAGSDLDLDLGEQGAGWEEEAAYWRQEQEEVLRLTALPPEGTSVGQHTGGPTGPALQGCAGEVAWDDGGEQAGDGEGDSQAGPWKLDLVTNGGSSNVPTVYDGGSAASSQCGLLTLPCSGGASSGLGCAGITGISGIAGDSLCFESRASRSISIVSIRRSISLCRPQADSTGEAGNADRSDHGCQAGGSGAREALAQGPAAPLVDLGASGVVAAPAAPVAAPGTAFGGSDQQEDVSDIVNLFSGRGAPHARASTPPSHGSAPSRSASSIKLLNPVRSPSWQPSGGDSRDTRSSFSPRPSSNNAARDGKLRNVHSSPSTPQAAPTDSRGQCFASGQGSGRLSSGDGARGCGSCDPRQDGGTVRSVVAKAVRFASGLVACMVPEHLQEASGGTDGSASNCRSR